MNRFVTLFAFGLTVAACTDAPTASHPKTRGDHANLDVVDGRHNSGNPHFFFLPPVVSSAPSAAGTFDGSLAVIVEICALTGSGCAGAPVARFTTTSGTSQETIRVVDDAYIVNWKTDEYSLVELQTYRIKVLVAGAELGHADVLFVNKGNAKNTVTSDLIPLNDGRTLPIKFRIEVGAIAVGVVGASGGAVTSSDGSVSLQFPAGALTEELTVTVTAQVATAADLSQKVIGGTVHEFLPSPTTFSAPVTLTIGFDPSQLPPGTQRSDLRLAKATRLTDGRITWRFVPGSGVIGTSNAVAGEIETFSEYAIAVPREIAFSGVYDPIGIWAVREDGTGMRQLTGTCGAMPRWSPDGTRLVFHTHDTNPYNSHAPDPYNDGCTTPSPELRTINADGSNEVSLGISGFNADWSPDGTRIVYEVLPAGSTCLAESEVWIANANGSGSQQLTFATAPLPHCGNLYGGWGRTPKWSPDGSKIVFTGVDGFYLMNPDGSALMRWWNDASFNAIVGYPPGTAGGFNPAWSPDGSQLLFTCGQPDESGEPIAVSNLCSMSAALTPTFVYRFHLGTGVGNPAFSPDGTKFAFIASFLPPADAQFPNVCIRNADDTQLTCVTSFAHGVGHGAWGPAWRP